MLSNENPSPDPCEISQLSSNFISSDEKASDNDNSNNNNETQLEVDLFKSGLDDINQTLPKFSIRDYVSSTRRKDFKTHWPFSPKHLQLCLKHGVKDVLPPFETLQSVKCADNKSSDPSLKLKLSGSSYPLLSNSSKNVNQKIDLKTENMKSNTSEKDREYNGSSHTRLSCPDVSSVVEPEPKNIPDLEKPEFAVRANKVKSITQNPAKKCRLIVKLHNNISEQKLNEDLLETMASKVCPVCKTFTSSSNTTLNAHIDQCLSGESTVKWMGNPKEIKHRIKPRKTRSMVDIYKTAICCTLDDLDRRNGTNWALNLGFPAQDLEWCDVEKNNNKHSSVISEDKKEEGAVYFDSNGTKIRILSKFSDVKPNKNDEDDCGPRKLVGCDEEKQVLSIKKKNKKNLGHRDKLLNFLPSEQRRFSPRLVPCQEVKNAHKTSFFLDETEKALEAHDQMKSDDSGMIKQWVSSKRTVHKRKKNPDHKTHHPNEITKNLNIKSRLPSLDHGKLIKRTSDARSPVSCDDNPLLATDQSHKRRERMPLYSDEEYMPCPTNRAGYSLLDSREFYDDKKNHMMLSKSNFKRLKEKRPSGAYDTKNHAVSRINKKMRSMSSTLNVDSSFISSRLSKHHVFSSGGKEFGSLKKIVGGKNLSPLSKNPLHIRRPFLLEAKKYLDRKRLLDFKKSAFHMQDDTVETRGRTAAQLEKDSSSLSLGKSRVLNIRRKRWGFLNSDKEGDTSSEHLNASSEPNSHGVEQNINSFASDNIPAGSSNPTKVVEISDDFVHEPISKSSGGEPLINFEQSLAYEEDGSPDLVLSSEQEIYCADKVNVGEGNYFDDVDPIPIPGPPGLFLPSPGRMGSEELQGDSSLTTSKIHSSGDGDRELIDHMDSSYSTVSDKSFVSNSIAPRSDSVLPFQSHVVQCDIFEKRTDIGADGLKLDESRGKLVIPETKFRICGDCESPSVSTSNPVLRLMGKNLMVVNKEEINLSPQTRPTQSGTVNDFPNLHSSVDNIQNVRQAFYHDNSSRGPPCSDDLQMFMHGQQHFDFAPSVGSSSNFKTSELSPHLSSAMHVSRNLNEGQRSSLDCRQYLAGGHIFTHDRLGSTIRLEAPIRISENGPSLGFKMMYHENSEGGGRGSPVGIYDSSHANSFYNYQTRRYPFSSGSQMAQNVSTQAPPPFKGTNRNSVNNWNIINRLPAGQSATNRDSLASLSPSTGHLRSSSLYFSPGFSLHANFT